MGKLTVDQIYDELRKVESGTVVRVVDAVDQFGADETDVQKALLKSISFGYEFVFCRRGTGSLDWTPNLLSLRDDYTSFQGEVLSGADPKNILLGFRRI